MRVGIFGGTFDPVHYGHLLLAECCREQCRLDVVWFLPTSVPPHKQNAEISSADHRLEMLNLAIAGNRGFAINRYELERGGVNYTFETLEHFRREDPKRELFFLMGGDSLVDLPTWREPAKICELATVVAVQRPGMAEIDWSALESCLSAAQIETVRKNVVEMPRVDFSAREIRRLASTGKSIRYRVPRAVEMYIQTHQLY